MGDNGTSVNLSKEIHKACGSLTIVKVFIQTLIAREDSERSEFLNQHSKLCTDAISHLETTLHEVKQQAHSGKGPRYGRVLIYDDNPDLAEMLTIAFTKNDYASQAIQNVEELNTHLSTHPVGNCLFLDYWLGENIKGTDVAVAIKRDYPRTKIIMMSGDDLSEVSEAKSLIDSGVVAGFIRKPFSFDTVKSFI